MNIAAELDVRGAERRDARRASRAMEIAAVMGVSRHFRGFSRAQERASGRFFMRPSQERTSCALRFCIEFLQP
ncbi:hypothetical protein WMF18_32860 [Sorangium sp. So ce315]|uniref:hypothetical protein n=1 Tax=Sorangium sp. So ce315 TaxID=3133299 RepID=UPI003F61E19B